MQNETAFNEKRKFQIEEGILILLLILSLLGISITDYSPADGYGYWIIMVIVFALFAILIAWRQSKHTEAEFKKIVLHQSLHWISTLLVVGGTFLLHNSGQLTAKSAGLVILLLLSLATMLDGLRIGWRFSLVGLFLGASAVISAYFKAFIWIDSSIAILIVAMTFAWEYWKNKRTT